MAAAPVTVTGVLQTIFNDVGEPLLVKAVSVGLFAIPGVGPALSTIFTWLMNAPVIGSLLQGWLKSAVDNMIANGVIEIKTGILKHLDEAAREKWKPEVELLEQYNDQGKVMTSEEQAAFDAALQNLAKNHPGVVNA